VVAEIGPGESLGIGIAALLSGAERYYALDVVEHATLESNLTIFDGLVSLFQAKVSIPDDVEFPEVKPSLQQYRFPSQILNQRRLGSALEPQQIATLRRALSQVSSSHSGRGPISYIVPWTSMAVLEPESVDLIVSQAAMEHVDGLEESYAACFRWLKPGGLMSHQVDYSSHETADEWNGHWTYSDLLWWAIRGGRPWLLNRIPHSEHLRLIRKQGFEVVYVQTVSAENHTARQHLARRFQAISAEDMTTRGALIQARKPS